MRRPRTATDKHTKALTGGDIARRLGVCYETAVKLPIPRLEITVGKRTFRRYKEEDVNAYIEANTKRP